MKQTIDEGKLKLLKVTCGSDLYDEVTEIGARIQILWTKDDVQKTGWKPRWSMFVIYFVLFLFVIQPLKLDIIHDTGGQTYIYPSHVFRCFKCINYLYIARLTETPIRMWYCSFQ